VTFSIVGDYVEAMRELHTARVARGPLSWIEESHLIDKLDGLWAEMTPEQRNNAMRTLRTEKR
jgi:hypothetical protein